jgi:hypothetical protein
MKRRHILIPLSVLVAIALGLGFAILLRKAAPPEPVRLLPEAQAFLYVNVNPLRKADIKMAPVQLDPDYEQFVRETGFQFERDLEQLAVAVHVPTSGLGTENRFTEVIVGRYDNEKVRRYLTGLSTRTDSYRDLEIFNIPRETRTVRVTLLGPDIVAISNADDPLLIRGIIDRYKKLALPFGGPQLVQQHYRKLPFGTLAWAIADIARGSEQSKSFVIPGGFDLFFPPDTVAVASVRYLGSIDFKARAITTSDDNARRVTDQLSAFLALFRSLETNAMGGDPDVKQFFNSLKIEQNGKEAVLTAELPKGFLEKLLTEPPPTPQVTAPVTEQKQPPKSQPKPRRKTQKAADPR